MELILAVLGDNKWEILYLFVEVLLKLPNADASHVTFLL